MIKTTAQILLTTILCLTSIQVGAYEPIRFDEPNPWAATNLCKMTSENFLAKSKHPANLTPEGNKPGRMGTGLCWWHSKMQRAALYLAVFDRPQDPPPTSEEASRIFRDLVDLKKTVSIPGFRNWFDFTFAYEVEFYKELNSFEERDILQLQFLKGVRRLSNPDNLTLTKIDQEVNDYKRLTYLLIKMGPMAAHSWLVNSFERRSSDFKLSFIDSNISSQSQFYQSVGNVYNIFVTDGISLERNPINGRVQHDTNYPPENKELKLFGTNNKAELAYITGEQIALYLQNDNQDFEKMASAIRNHCGGETPFTLKEKENVKIKIQREFERQNWFGSGVPHN